MLASCIEKFGYAFEWLSYMDIHPYPFFKTSQYLALYTTIGCPYMYDTYM